MSCQLREEIKSYHTFLPDDNRITCLGSKIYEVYQYNLTQRHWGNSKKFWRLGLTKRQHLGMWAFVLQAFSSLLISRNHTYSTLCSIGEKSLFFPIIFLSFKESQLIITKSSSFFNKWRDNYSSFSLSWVWSV